MFRAASFNVNGIRAAQRRGFATWLDASGCDVVALQEMRCPLQSLPDDVFAGYHAAYDPGRLAGRNGVAILTRTPVAAVRVWTDSAYLRDTAGTISETPADLGGPLPRALQPFRHEGRYIEVDLADRPLTVASVYVPKGGLPDHLQLPGRMRQAPDGGAAYARKQRFLDGFARLVAQARRSAAADGRHYLLMGDVNIAHQPQDVTNHKRQVKAVGFLPEERGWIETVLGPRRLVDVVRQLHPQAQGPYSWWSWMGQSFDNDTGWRIDYHLASPALARAARAAQVHREASRDQRVSDHAAVVVDYEI